VGVAHAAPKLRQGDRAAANRAAELIGRHIGMFVDRKSIEISYIDDADEYLQRIMELVSPPVLEHEAPQLEHVENDGQKYGSDQQAEPYTADIIEDTG
jgi:hypothetical protein